MKIVFLLNQFMPYQVAGTEVYSWALAKSLTQKGHEIIIVVPNYGSNDFDEYVYDGLNVKRYPEQDKADKLIIMGKKAPDGVKSFEALIRRIDPDLVHIQELAGSIGIGIYHVRMLNRIGIKILFTMHLAIYSCFCGSLMYKGVEACSGKIDIERCTRCALHKLPISNATESLLYKLSLPLYKLGINTGKLNHAAGTAFSYPFIIENIKKNLFEVVGLCEYVVAIADWYREILLINGIPREKIKLVKQALPCQAGRPTSVIASGNSTLRLAFIGRIDPLKGLHLLLEAMNDLPENKISLDIFGGVINAKYYNDLKNKTKDKSNIHWKGLLEQKDVVETLSKYYVLCLPSMFSEMSPLVIQEAFAAGIPVLASNVYGNAEQIKDGVNGWLFNYDSAADLKDRLKAILAAPQQVSEARKNLPAVRSFNDVANEYDVIYNQIKNKKISSILPTLS